MFQLTGIKQLHNDMKRKKKTRDNFSFSYNNKIFSCIFIIDVIPYRLYLTTIGENPVVFELEIQKGYLVKTYFEDYHKLLDYLELKYNPNHIFRPIDFLVALNKNIPNKFTKAPHYSDVLFAISKCRTVEESSKIYFCGWYTNPDKKRVRETNIEKTRDVFGDDIASMCKEKNISSCWTDKRGEENLSRFYEFLK